MISCWLVKTVMKKYLNRIMSFVLAFALVSGLFVYFNFTKSTQKVEAGVYENTMIPSSDYLLIENFEADSAPNGGTRNFVVDAATALDPLNEGENGPQFKRHNTSSDAGKFVPAKGMIYGHLRTYYWMELSKSLPADARCATYGKLKYGNTMDLSKYEHISVYLALDCENINSDANQKIDITVRFGSTSSCGVYTSDGWGRTITLNHDNHKIWEVFDFDLPKTTYSDTNNHYGNCNANVPVDWTKIDFISFRHLAPASGDSTDFNKAWGYVNIGIDYIIAWNDNDNTAPTIESFDSYDRTGSNHNQDSRIGTTHRGWAYGGTDSFISVQSTNARESTNCLRVYDKNLFAEAVTENNITYYGSQCYIRLRNPVDLTDYSKLEFDIYISSMGTAISDSKYECKLWVNFVSANRKRTYKTAEDDGWNSSVSFQDLKVGWNTITINKSQLTATDVYDNAVHDKESGNTLYDKERALKRIDTLTFRTTCNKSCYDATASLGRTNVTGAMLDMYIDDLRGEKAEQTKEITLKNGYKALRITNISAYNRYGLNRSNNVPEFSTSTAEADLPPQVSYNPGTRVIKFNTTPSSTNRWRIMGDIFLPTTRDISPYNYIAVEMYIKKAPKSGLLQMQFAADRFNNDQAGVNYYFSDHCKLKSGWNRFYINIASELNCYNNPHSKDYILSHLRHIRISYVADDNSNEPFEGILAEIYAVKDSLNENKLPIVDSMSKDSSFGVVAGSNTTVSFITDSEHSQDIKDHNNNILMNKDSAVLKVETKAGTVNPASQGSDHYINTQVSFFYDEPKDFRPYSTINLSFWSSVDLPGGTFEINFRANDYVDESDGYNCRISANDIKAGTNILKINRYSLRPVGGAGGQVSLENPEMADWAYIQSFRITYYQIDDSSESIPLIALTWYIDAMYLTNEHYDSDAEVTAVRNQVDALYNELNPSSCAINLPDDFSKSGGLFQQYAALQTAINNLENDRMWKGKTYDKVYFGSDSEVQLNKDANGNFIGVSSTTSPTKKVNDGYDYQFFKIYTGYQDKLTVIQKELEKAKSLSQTIYGKNGKEYNSFTTDSTIGITDNSSYTVCYTLKRSNATTYYSDALDSGVNPWIYLNSASGDVKFPVGTNITLRRVGSNYFTNYYKTITASDGVYIKFSDFKTMDTNSGTYWGEMSSSFPAKNSSYTYLIIVDMSRVAEENRLSPAQQYTLQVWSADTKAVAKTNGNIYLTGNRTTQSYTSKTFGLTAERTSDSLISTDGVVVVDGNITVGGVNSNANDTYNKNRNVTLTAEIFNAQGERVNIPQGTTVTAKQNGTTVDAVVRCNNQVFTKISVPTVSAAAQTVPYEITFDFGTARTYLAAAEGYRIVVKAYNGYDVAHPNSGDNVAVVNNSSTDFDMTDGKFNAVLADNNQTLLKKSEGNQVMNFTVSKSGVINSVVMELQRKNSSGNYERIDLSAYATIDSSYIEGVVGETVTLKTTVSGNLPITFYGGENQMETGTYRVVFRSKTQLYDLPDVIIGFVAE